MSYDKYKVSYQNLRKNCNYDKEIKTCDTLVNMELTERFIGQERAVKSMQFGLNMNSKGYNIFVAGLQGTGKSTYTEAAVRQKAGRRVVPSDWCYVNNFNEWHKPIAISLPSGKGKVFQNDVDNLISNLKIMIPKAFESTEYQQKKDIIIQSVNENMDITIHKIEKEAFENGFAIDRAPSKLVLIPMKYGRPIMPEEYGKLSAEEHKHIDETREMLAIKIEEKLRAEQIFEKEANDRIIELEKHTAYISAKPHVDNLIEKYKEYTNISEYLNNILEDVSKNHAAFKSDMVQFRQTNADKQNQTVKQPSEDMNEYDTMIVSDEEYVDSFNKYKVNLFIDNEKSEGAPVVIESSPYYYDLFGKIEYRSQMLSMTTDFTMIKPGAIHRANGGYLVLQAKDLLMDPFLWEALKRALKYRKATIENIGEQYRLVPTVTLKPEPIPLDIKIILIGSPAYYMLFSMDEDFKELFKVKVDFDMEMDRNDENINQYISFINSRCQQERLKDFDSSGIAKVIEFGSRLAGYQNKLSTHFNKISDILFESSSIAEEENAAKVSSEHVNKAVKNRRYRFNMVEEKLQESIFDGTVIIETKGEVVGQLNGLFVIETAGYIFGLPARITARTYLGRGGVINIERETKMSGSIHSKGVLTLTGYLGGKLAQNKPMGLTAQVTFEQLYEGVEGDSASSAELYAILSSLSGVPLKQSIAVTGSVDQFGVIQPIGGVTEKIEGFFGICNGLGLTGEQGVLIPERNIKNLILKDEVLEAVKNNMFHIYAVKTVDEGIEILTGIRAGEIDENGNYPDGSIFDLAEKTLSHYYKALNKDDNS